jgi:hypothetical protein
MPETATVQNRLTLTGARFDKVSGKTIYAVMSFGGFLRIGEKYHPLLWSR